MDNLVLIRVAAALTGDLSGAVLRQLREETRARYRLVFERPGKPASTVVSLDSRRPWIGRPMARPTRTRGPKSPFGAAASRALEGRPIRGVDKQLLDRSIAIRFADGAALVIELAPPRPNLIVIDGDGRIESIARRSRSNPRGLEPGAEYAPAALPPRLVDPFSLDPSELDAIVEDERADGRPVEEALTRRLFGITRSTAKLVMAEAEQAGRSPGAVLAARLAALDRGELDPVIAAEEDPWEAAQGGRLDPSAVALLPWQPHRPGAYLRRDNAAGTAGLYHEAIERHSTLIARFADLRTLIDREIDRLMRAERRVREDMQGFEDSGRYRRWGEALLAGLGRERRVGDAVMVPDPYDADGAEIPVPVPPGKSVKSEAERMFARYRRAERGRDAARRRSAKLHGQRERLQALRGSDDGSADPGLADRLEREMREAGLPVGLETKRASSRVSTRSRPRLEGVRMHTSSDGLSILIGKSGRDNHRLTFQLASPEDFWLHVLGCTGAHVIVRNEARRPRPPEATLREAAAAAAWYSEASRQTYAEVQWTRRKYVRKPRGAAPGTVVIKRFETIRVRPAMPVSSGDRD